jgi:hypothetical protein
MAVNIKTLHFSDVTRCNFIYIRAFRRNLQPQSSMLQMEAVDSYKNCHVFTNLYRHLPEDRTCKTTYAFYCKELMYKTFCLRTTVSV